MKLNDRDTAVLELLGAGPTTVDDLAAKLERDAVRLAERLDELADNGLVAERGDRTVERTESGRRVLIASTSGVVDGRIDTTAADERALAAFDLGPDEAEAVRSAFAVIRYWGSVTPEELVDAVFAEMPAGYDDSSVWWTDLVREPLAALPDVVPPDAPGQPWRYAGIPEVALPTTDGRRVLDRSGRVHGSVKDVIESLEVTDEERAAIHAAFTVLKQLGAATEGDIAERVFPQHAAGYDDSGTWWDRFLREAFRQLPHLAQSEDGEWCYRQSPTRRTRPRQDDEGR